MPRKAINRICTVDGCDREVKAKGLCPAHYRMNRLHGRTHTIIKSYKNGVICNWDGCSRQAEVCGYCRTHYQTARRTGILYPGQHDRDHPFYRLWWGRRQADVLGPEWANDFARFVVDVGEKPGKFYSLVTRHEGPFGPENFEWRPHIKRLPGESKRAFHARKWQAQNDRRPGWGAARDLKRKYGITPDQYDGMLERQNGVCAVCQCPETKIEHKTGIIKRLAVDHCHKTGKVRGLLCSRCNLAIGSIDESIELLRAMEMYMQRHLNENLL